MEAAAVEEAALAPVERSASFGTVRKPSESVPHTPGHAVRRECADRVVDPDLLDEEHAEHDDRTGDEPDA